MVKHFNWKARGKRRIHEKPNAREVRACRPGFEAEVVALAPPVIVGFRVTQQRGALVTSPFAPHVLATMHPSSLLRGASLGV